MIKGIEHIAIISSSEKSIEFYSKLGFEEFYRRERQYDTVVLLRGYGVQLEIFIDENHPQRAAKPENFGLRHLSLEVDDLEKVRKEFNCSPVMEDWFSRKNCFTSDPDGLPIEFIEISKKEFT